MPGDILTPVKLLFSLQALFPSSKRIILALNESRKILLQVLSEAEILWYRFMQMYKIMFLLSLCIHRAVFLLLGWHWVHCLSRCRSACDQPLHKLRQPTELPVPGISAGWLHGGVNADQQSPATVNKTGWIKPVHVLFFATEIKEISAAQIGPRSTTKRNTVVVIERAFLR